ncbi:MAG: histidine kinase, partial [Chthoniobacteraceae bacterium]
MRPDECLLLLNSAGRILWARVSPSGFLGYSAEELRGMEMPRAARGAAAADSFLAPVVAAFRAAASDPGGEGEGDARFRGKNGGESTLRWHLSVLPSASGEREVLLAFSKGMPASSAGRAGGSDNALEGVFRSALDGTLLEASPVFARMFGYDSPEEMMRAVKNVGSEIAADPERCMQFFQVMGQEWSVEGWELEVVKADGTFFWIAVSASLLRGVAGEPPQLEGRVIDITRQKRAEQEAERARRQLREMTARLDDVREEERTSIARELHDDLGKSLTLLTLDLAWLRGRLAKTAPDDVQASLLEKIGKMEQTIKVTLDTLRRILTALRPPLLDELGLKEAMEFEVQEFSKRMGIRFEIRAMPVTVTADRTRTAVFRIFQELLTNVARHARASRIKVDLKEVDSALVLVVEDNGCGISEEHLAGTRSFGILG